MTRDFAAAVATSATDFLSVKATPVQRGLAWVVELTLDGQRVVLRDGEDLAFVVAEQRARAAS